MSAIEDACRWTIVQAYACWVIDHRLGRVDINGFIRDMGLTV